eukprot:scaffold5535_cov180-Amphora_coffeaeformis.AAC.14
MQRGIAARSSRKSPPIFSMDTFQSSICRIDDILTLEFLNGSLTQAKKNATLLFAMDDDSSKQKLFVI